MNVATHLEHWASQTPTHTALTYPQKNSEDQKMSFHELNRLSNRYASGLASYGVQKGDRTLVFIKQGPDFIAMTFALLKLGAIPIFIDPAMGLTNLKICLARVRPSVLIGIVKVHLLRPLMGRSLSTLKLSISPSHLFGDASLKNVYSKGSDEFNALELDDSEMASILFTSGGTGIPKGVVYTHKTFNAQIDMLKSMFGLTAYDIDCPGFPLFSMLSLCIGMQSSIPDLDPRRPSKACPKKLYKTLNTHKVTFAAGSPAIWERLIDHCIQNKLELSHLKYLVLFGAPISAKLIKKCHQVLQNGDVYTPYGATESLPIAVYPGKQILKSYAMNPQEKSIFLGPPVKGVKVKIIHVNQKPLRNFSEVQECLTGEIGEIIVTGPSTTKEYDHMPEHTRLAKIYDGETVWHRMGDLGKIDQYGYLWFCGRVKHQVKLIDRVLYPIPCENVFNQHKMVKRSALINLKDGRSSFPGIVIERIDGQTKLNKKEKEQFQKELIELGQISADTKDITHFFYARKFPVDIRHNIKIDREKLSKMAQEQLS